MEVRLDDTPLEAGLMFTCKLKTDTDFQGRAALEQRREDTEDVGDFADSLQ